MIEKEIFMKKYDTPSFVFDLNKINLNINKLKKGMNLLPKYHLCYSTKTNPLRNIVLYMESKGLYAECVSKQEYEYLSKLNISCEKIIFNGPIKTEEDLLLAINNNSYINLDSLNEVYFLIDNKEKLKDYERLGLRVNIDLGFNKMIKKIGYKNSRFGFSYEEFDKAINLLKENDIKVTGLHYHINSNYDIVEVYKYIVRNIKILINKYDLRLKNLNFGGGILRSVEDTDFTKYSKIIIEEFKKEKMDISQYEFFFEPGAALVANSGMLYSSIMTEKFINDEKYLTLDISKNYFDITNKFGDWKHYRIFMKNRKKAIVRKQIICGFTCMEGDRIFSLNDQFELKKGDIIVFDKVGAYSICLSSLFINGFPKLYYISNNRIVECIKEKTFSEFWV